MEANGVLQVEDPRVIRPGRRGFDRRLIERLAACPDVASARLDLTAGTCRIEFAPNGQDLRQRAQVFNACVHSALEDERAGIPAPWLGEHSWTTLLVQRNGDSSVVLEALEGQPGGRLSLRVGPAVKSRRPWSDLLGAIAQVEGVRTVRVRRWSDGLDVDYDPSRASGDTILAVAARAWGTPRSPSGHVGENARELSPAPGTQGRALLVRGPRRLLYMAMGGGCFVLTLVGLVVPGIPTVPFLMAAGYYLARSSPTLHRCLIRSRFFGPILAEWETHHALSRQSKTKLAGFTLVVILIALFVAFENPVLLLIVLLMASLSLYGLARIPEIIPSAPPQLALTS